MYHVLSRRCRSNTECPSWRGASVGSYFDFYHCACPGESPSLCFVESTRRPALPQQCTNEKAKIVELWCLCFHCLSETLLLDAHFCSNMAAQVLIDLSLSTDDEKSPQSKGRAPKEDAKRANAKQDFMYLSDGIDGIDDASSLKENPPKRRKSSNLSTSKAREVASSIPSTHPTHLRPVPPKRAPLTNKIYGRQNLTTFSDEILFTSSADINSVLVPPSKVLRREGSWEDPDDSLPEDAFSAAPPDLAFSISGRTAALLAKLKNPVATKRCTGSRLISTAPAPWKTHSISTKGRQEPILDDASSEEEEAQPRAKAVGKQNLTEEEKLVRSHEREEAKAEKVAQKARDKEEGKEKRKIQRNEKAREKQRAADLSEVNKAKKDKKETSKEMIVDLPMSIEGQRVEDQIQEFLKNLDIEINTYQSPVVNVVRWRRKVDSYFDEGKGYRIATPKEIRDERHALCLMTAKEFIKLATAASSDVDSETLAEHIRKFKTKFVGCTPIYLIEGFNAWMRKNKSLRDKEYRTAVLDQVQRDDATAASASHRTSRAKQKPEVYVEEDLIEDALLQLQVMNNCLIHHTATPHESAEWVANFTQHISLIPYR